MKKPRNIIQNRKISFNKDVSEFIEDSSSVVTVEDNTYFFLPFWFMKKGDGGNPYEYEVYPLEKLPKELTDAIEDKRKSSKP